MKRKRLFILTLLMLVSVSLVAGVYATQTEPDDVTMDSKVYKNHKKGLVTFTHKKHSGEYKIGCVDCHHVYDGGKNTWKQGDPVQKCQACHKDTGKPEKGMSKKEKIDKFHKEALHANCVTCHKELNKAGKKAPAKCKDCHPKK